MKTSVATITAHLPVTRHEMEIPMVNWHNPWADFTYGGVECKLQIAGGCQAIWVTVGKDNPISYSVSIKDLLPTLVEQIQILEAKPKK